MKKLLVKYTNDNGDSVILYDGGVAEIEWGESSDSLRVAAKFNSHRVRQAGQGNSGMNLLEMLAGAARSRSAAEEGKAPAESGDSSEPASGEQNGIEVTRP